MNTTSTAAAMPLGRYYREQFSPSQLDGKSKWTRHQFGGAIKAMLRFCEGDTTVSQLTPELLDDFGRWLLVQGASKRIARRYRNHVWDVGRHAMPATFPARRYGRPLSAAPLKSVDQESRPRWPVYEIGEPGTLSNYYETVYRPWRHPNAKHATIAQHQWVITSLCKFANHNVTIHEVTPKFLRAWSIWAMANGFQKPGAECYCSVVRSIVRHADPASWPLPSNRDSLWKQAGNGTLISFLREVYAIEHDVEQSTVKQYSYCVFAFGQFLMKSPTVDDLTTDNVNRFLMDYAKNHKPDTVKGKRRGLLTIWRALYEAELIEHYPRRIRKLKPVKRVIIAWTPSDVQTLFDCAGSLKTKSRKSGVPKRLFWQLLILLAYETGMRRGDCLDVDLREIPTNGIFQRVQNKTGNVITCELSSQAMELVADIRRYGASKLAGSCELRAVSKEFKRLMDRAELRGSFKFIRRAGATAVEKEQPGAATKFLGHKTPGLAMQHYVDQSQLMQQRPKPPAIGERKDGVA